MQDTRSSFLTPDSPHDEPIIVSDESEEEKTKRYEDTHTTSHDGPEYTSISHPLSPKLVQFQELMTQLLADLKEIPKITGDFTFYIYSSLPQVQEKLKTLDAVPSLLNKVIDTLNRTNAEDEETESDYEDDHANPSETMAESSKQKKMKKFSFVTKRGEQIHLTAENIEKNFDSRIMELENSQNNALAKLPMLKLGEYEMWEIRIKQYFQIQDYAL
ncbi:hypothetical protein Tco_0597097 [Tanacetum coccineum]